MKHHASDDWLTVQEAAALKGVSNNSMLWACKRGEVVSRRFGHKVVQILRSSLDNYQPRNYPRTRQPLAPVPVPVADPTPASA